MQAPQVRVEKIKRNKKTRVLSYFLLCDLGLERLSYLSERRRVASKIGGTVAHAEQHTHPYAINPTPFVHVVLIDARYRTTSQRTDLRPFHICTGIQIASKHNTTNTPFTHTFVIRRSSTQPYARKSGVCLVGVMFAPGPCVMASACDRRDPCVHQPRLGAVFYHLYHSQPFIVTLFPLPPPPAVASAFCCSRPRSVSP